MKYKLSLLLTLLSINLLSEEQLYLVDLILIKYLPDFETNEKFFPPELDIPENITFLTEFPYPKLEINSLPFNLEYKFQDLFMSVKIEEDSDLSISEDDTPSDIGSIPTLEVNKSVFEIDSAREFSLSADKENSLAESISKTDLFTSKVGIDPISLGVSSSEIDKSESSSIFTDINKS